MAARTAEEAELSDENIDRSAPRPRTEKNANNAAPAPPPDDLQEKDLDVITYLPTPPPEPLDIQGWDTVSNLENVHPAQEAKWKAVTGAKLLTYKAYGGKIEEAEDIAKIQDLIKVSLGLTTDPTVASPNPLENLTRRDPPPFCALVKNLSPEKAQELIERKFLSSKDLTVLFIPYTPPAYPFITTLKGFIFINKTAQETEEAVADAVAETLFDGDGTETATAVRHFVANNKDNIPTIIINNIEDTLRYLRKSITIRRMDLKKREDIGTGEGEGRPAWNLYMYPPTQDHKAMRTWRLLIRKTTFVTESNGAGRTHKIFTCTTCRSTDHPGGMCLFPKENGWNDPTPTHSQTLEDLLNPTPRGNPRGTGARGRGIRASSRGRGSAGRGRGYRGE